uniref:NADH-ubiquinone oxidoreductase chain 2 n=1 Tax=Syrbatus sp. 1 RRMO-2024a TaxID=3154167 RepID=A0AAU7LKM9_9COLE
MYMNIFLMSFLIFSTLITISSNSWFGMWIGLEINLMSFIPIMNSNNNMYSSESSMKYFFVQALSSMILFFSLIYFYLSKSKTLIMFNIIMMMKMGSAPFHFWFIEIMNKLNWYNSFMLMSWQKLTPMIIINYSMNFYLIMFIICLNMLISLIKINQNSIQKIFSYSSINNMGWMMSLMLINKNLWMMFISIYSTILFNLIYLLNMYKIFMMNHLFMKMNFNLFNLFLFSNFISMMSIPPFIGFLTKWMTIQNLIFNNYYLITITMMMMTSIMSYMYIKMILNSFLLNSLKNNFYKMIIIPKSFHFNNFFNLISMILSPYFFMLT